MKFLGVFLVTLGLLVAAYLGAVGVVDPRAELRDPLKPRPFPTRLANARTEKMQLFHAYSQRGPVTGLILGSSRAMKLRPAELDRLTGLRFFNFAVESACVEDYLAIYRWAVAQEARPKLLLIGLDVEALHNNDQPDDRFEQNPTLQAALGEAGSAATGVQALAQSAQRWKGTLNASYWKDTRRAFKAWLNPPKAEDMLSKLEADGYLRYPKWEHEKATGSFDLAREVEGKCEDYIRRFTGMTELSSRRRAWLEKLLAEARAGGTEVRIYITTLHPVLAKRVEAKTGYASQLDSTRRYLKDLEARFGIRSFDFSAPDQFGATPTGWYDGAHLDEGNVTLLSQRLLEGWR